MHGLIPILTAAFLMVAPMAQAFTFNSIDGGTLSLDEYKGRPVLVVNTASRCGFTPQYNGLQALQDRYAEAGLVVLAVPSDDFHQELSSADEVRDFCEVNFGLTLPMTDITPVRGRNAHPFYQWVRAETGFEPRWNFNKVLVGVDGTVKGTFGSVTRPQSSQITQLIDAELAAAP